MIGRDAPCPACGHAVEPDGPAPGLPLLCPHCGGIFTPAGEPRHDVADDLPVVTVPEAADDTPEVVLTLELADGEALEPRPTAQSVPEVIAEQAPVVPPRPARPVLRCPQVEVVRRDRDGMIRWFRLCLFEHAMVGVFLAGASPGEDLHSPAVVRQRVSRERWVLQSIDEHPLNFTLEYDDLLRAGFYLPSRWHPWWLLLRLRGLRSEVLPSLRLQHLVQGPLQFGVASAAGVATLRQHLPRFLGRRFEG